MNRTLFLFIGFLVITGGCRKSEPFSEKLWYGQPAADWFEALPIGNGRVGAMVHGDVMQEHLQLNEESLWAGCPEQPYPENVQAHYHTFQQLNLERRFDEAYQYALKHLATSPTCFRSYEPFGDLRIGFDHSGVTSYRRELDLSTGIASVFYETEGKRFKRETFVSFSDDVLVYRFESLENQKVDVRFAFDRDKDAVTSVLGNGLKIEGQIYDDPRGYDDNAGGSGKGGAHMKFSGLVRVIDADGSFQENDSLLLLNNTTSFTLLMGLATNYSLEQLNFDEGIDGFKKAELSVEQAARSDYKSLKAAHVKEHQAMYERVDLTLANISKDTVATDVRIERLKQGLDDPYLSQVLFQYGRYLLMTSSGGKAVLPANLQGIWNKDMWAAWESDYHMNINLQMNYWPADVCNLSETVQPLSEYLVYLTERGYETAQKYIGSEGWMLHATSNVFGRTTPSGSNAFFQVSVGYSFPLAGAWMTQSLWRHFQFTQDLTYLRETLYPILKGSSRFIMDFLQEDSNGLLVTAPSYSPENEYIDPATGKALANTVASSIDIQIIRDVLKNCLEAEERLGISELSDEIQSVLSRLPQIQVGANGTIMEWIEDYEEATPGHRHISHLYGLFPSSQINPSRPELYQAARKTLERRLSFGGGQTGWSRAWMVNFYARLMDGQACHKHINELLKNQMTNNLFDLHPPRIFQIDGNLGVTAGMAEMLVQSHEPGIIRLLPALPGQWSKGAVKGLKARGNFELDLEWDEGLLTQMRIKAISGGEVKVVYQSEKIELALKKGESKEIKF